MKTSNENKSRFLTVLILLLIPGILLAQMGRDQRGHEKHKEKIESHKIAFITEKLELTPSEAEKFWPVYHEHKNKVSEEIEKFRAEHDFGPNEIAQLEDKKAQALLDSQLAHERFMLEMRASYYNDLKPILPPQKILRLVEVEKEFKVELMRMVSGRNDGRGERRK